MGKMLARFAAPIGVIVVLGILHVVFYQPFEPFFNNDETRHVMTGVFFRDLILDHPISNPVQYVFDYYLQYPALGIAIWPPLFYFLEGLLMIVFGPSFHVSKILILLFAALAGTYLFRLVNRTHDIRTATVALALFGLSPLVFTYSRHVMMEIPTLAWGLVSIYHFLSYLESERRRDIVIAAVAAALAALTRFSAIYLLPTFLILLVTHKQWRILARKEVILSALLALVLVAPSYIFIASQYSWVHSQSATEGMVPDGRTVFDLQSFIYYIEQLPKQIGWFVLVPAVVGLIAAFSPRRWPNSAPYIAMLLGAYLAVAWIPQVETRYVIYWIPAFALLAVEGLAFARRLPYGRNLYIAITALVVLGTAWITLQQPRHYVRGYEEAAKYVLSNDRNARFCLFDGGLNGNFIYQVRRLDPDRKLWVLRSDKILYQVVLVPTVYYRESSNSDKEMLDVIYDYSPSFIVVEEPRTFVAIPMADRFRRLLASHPKRFRLEKVIAVESNVSQFRVKLKIYRNLVRNPKPKRRPQFEIPGSASKSNKP